MWDERQIVEACRRSERRAQEMLFKHLAPRMLAMCCRYCRDEDHAREVMQEGFIKVFANIHKFEFKSTLSTWATRIMINTAMDSLKKGKRTIDFEYVDFQESPLAEKAEETISLPEISEKELMAIIRELPDGCRTVFNLYAIDGFTHVKIGEMLGISEGTSKSQLNRARKLLKEKLSKRKIFG